MKAFVLLLFSLFYSNAYCENSNMGELINRFEQINSDQIEADCPPNGAPSAAQPSTPELPYVLKKFDSLSHNGKSFDCKEKVIKGCAFHQCLAPAGMFSTYPKPLAVLIPKHMTEINSYRVHFHGFSYFNKPYDRSMDSMIKAFEFGKSTCRNNTELTILPFSKNNKNTHHHTYLASTKKFDGFMKEFQSLTDDDKNIPVRLSGHSGGGKVVSKIVSYIKYDPASESATRRVKEVDVYDGLYGSSWVENYSSWFKKSKGVNLNIYSIKNSGTHNLSRNLFNRFGDNAQTTKKTNSETGRSYFKTHNKWGENNITLVQEKARGGEHHWEMNRDFWNLDIE